MAFMQSSRVITALLIRYSGKEYDFKQNFTPRFSSSIGDWQCRIVVKFLPAQRDQPIFTECWGRRPIRQPGY